MASVIGVVCVVVCGLFVHQILLRRQVALLQDLHDSLVGGLVRRFGEVQNAVNGLRTVKPPRLLPHVLPEPYRTAPPAPPVELPNPEDVSECFVLIKHEDDGKRTLVSKPLTFEQAIAEKVKIEEEKNTYPSTNKRTVIPKIHRATFIIGKQVEIAPS